MCSPAQINFINKLLGSKQHDLVIDTATLEAMPTKQASALIDKLMALPPRPDSPDNFVTENQANFIKSLATQKQNGVETLAEWLQGNFVDSVERLERSLGSEVIEHLKTLPEKARPALEVGAYCKDGVFYAVRVARESKRPYALEWRALTVNGDPSWVYDSKAIHILTPADRLTLEQAVAFGVGTGQCVHCGKALKDPKAIAQGIGSTCKKKYAPAPSIQQSSITNP